MMVGDGYNRIPLCLCYCFEPTPFSVGGLAQAIYFGGGGAPEESFLPYFGGDPARPKTYKTTNSENCHQKNTFEVIQDFSHQD